MKSLQRLFHGKKLQKLLRRLLRGKKLIGKNEIEEFLDLQAPDTLPDWLRAYELPVYKEEGVLVAYIKDLKKWQATHPEAKESLQQPVEFIQSRNIRRRFGLIEAEAQKIRRRFYKI